MEWWHDPATRKLAPEPLYTATLMRLTRAGIDPMPYRRFIITKAGAKHVAEHQVRSGFVTILIIIGNEMLRMPSPITTRADSAY